MLPSAISRSPRAALLSRPMSLPSEERERQGEGRVDGGVFVTVEALENRVRVVDEADINRVGFAEDTARADTGEVEQATQ